MKRNFCRFLGVFLAVMMIAGMIPMTAFADGEELYDLWVGGERFSAEKTSVACGSGTAVYNAETATLTLTDAAITSVYEYKSGYEAMIYSEVPKLTIVLAGNNTMKSDSRYADGIDASGGQQLARAVLVEVGRGKSHFAAVLLAVDHSALKCVGIAQAVVGSLHIALGQHLADHRRAYVDAVKHESLASDDPNARLLAIFHIVIETARTVVPETVVVA